MHYTNMLGLSTGYYLVLGGALLALIVFYIVYHRRQA